jgi:tetratricopeptide (TPR) repeat protein
VIGGDAAGARAAAERRLVHLDRAVVADTVADRRVDDWPRVDTLIFLDRHDQAIAQMTAREAELPDDGNAPAYLARAYADLERWDDALAAIDRAIARSPGPKGVRYLADRADLALEAGRPDLARAAIATARARWSALPEPMRSKGAKAQLDELETKLAAPPTVAPTPATR